MQPRPGSDDLARFERFLSIADTLAGWRGHTGAPSGWDRALDLVKEAPAIISPILAFISNAMVLRQGRSPMTGAAPGAGMPAAFDPYRDQATTAQYAASLRNLQNQSPATPPPPAAPPASAASAAGAAFYAQQMAAQQGAAAAPQPAAVAPDNIQPGAAANGQQPQNAELMQLLTAYGGIILNVLNSGQSGADLASWVVDGFGAATHAQIANFGEQSLTQALAARGSGR